MPPLCHPSHGAALCTPTAPSASSCLRKGAEPHAPGWLRPGLNPPVGEWLRAGPVSPIRHMVVLWAGGRGAAARGSAEVPTTHRAGPPAGRQPLGEEEAQAGQRAPVHSKPWSLELRGPGRRGQRELRDTQPQVTQPRHRSRLQPHRHLQTRRPGPPLPLTPPLTEPIRNPPAGHT